MLRQINLRSPSTYLRERCLVQRRGAASLNRIPNLTDTMQIPQMFLLRAGRLRVRVPTRHLKIFTLPSLIKSQ